MVDHWIKTERWNTAAVRDTTTLEVGIATDMFVSRFHISTAAPLTHPNMAE